MSVAAPVLKVTPAAINQLKITVQERPQLKIEPIVSRLQISTDLGSVDLNVATPPIVVLRATARDLKLDIIPPPLVSLVFSQADGSGGGGGSPVPDGIYTVGLGISQDGKLTFAGGVITSIQEAQV